MNDEPRIVLTLSCPDQVGIVAAVSGYIADAGGWIVESASHSEPTSNRFFMREEMTVAEPDDFVSGFAAVAARFDMTWKVSRPDVPKRVAILVSKEEHCLYDLLSRKRSGEIADQIVCVIGNHPDLADVARWHGIEFHEVDDKDFDAVRRILDDNRIDVAVLARYMQILPEDICRSYAGRLINIHHSVLPSFAGARPYHQAYERGVKLIGATCHYVTADLDEGPIIEQDVIRIDHSDDVDELRRAGKDIEKAVLARGLRWHLEDRVLIDGRRTVVFA